MTSQNSIVAIFTDHTAAEAAVKKLASARFEMKDISIVGKGYHSDEKVVGFYNMGDRVQFWGTRGAMWGGLWGLFFGGLFLTVPLVGGVVVLGTLATIIAAGIENAVIVGGISAIGAALYSLNIPKDSVVQYEAAIKADGFLVLVNGSAADIERAKSILATTPAASIDIHAGKPESLPVAV